LQKSQQQHVKAKNSMMAIITNDHDGDRKEPG
jgi:hypothetical protein